MSNFDDLYQGFIIMITFSFVGLILAIFGGFILDHVFATMDAGGFLDVPPNWQSMGGLWTVMNLYYLCTMLFPVTGIILFFRAIQRKTGQDNYLMN
jgi:hypothetical protein